MEDENTNPETGVLSVEDAAASLLIPEAEAEGPQLEAPEETEAEDADQPEAPEAEPEEEPVFTVKVDGKEIEVPQSELIAGYQKDADYRTKTQKLADERRQMEARQAQIESMREAYEARLSEMAQGQEEAPDWEKLAKELDPWDYQLRQATWLKTQAQKEAAREELRQQQAQRARELHQQEEARLLEVVPEWRDNTKRVADAREMLSVGVKDYGFTEQEIATTLDHRLIRLLRDAAAYRKMKAANPVEKRAPKTGQALKPGARQSAAAQKQAKAEASREKLRKTGSIDAAVEYLLSGDK